MGWAFLAVRPHFWLTTFLTTQFYVLSNSYFWHWRFLSKIQFCVKGTKEDRKWENTRKKVCRNNWRHGFDVALIVSKASHSCVSLSLVHYKQWSHQLFFVYYKVLWFCTDNWHCFLVVCMYADMAVCSNLDIISGQYFTISWERVLKSLHKYLFVVNLLL